MKLKDIMHRDIHAIDVRNTSVSDAIDKMTGEGTDFLVAMKEGEVAGVVTGGDLAFRCLGEGHRPWDCMVFRHVTVRVISAPPAMEIEDAAQLMIDEGIRHLLVMEGHRVMGVVSLPDVTRALLGARRKQAV